MRFVFVTDKLPRAGSAGHLALNHAIVEWLRRGGHDVTILMARPRLSWPVERYVTATVSGPAIACWRGFVFATTLAGASSITARRLLGRLPVGAMEFLRRIAWMRSYGGVDAVLGGFISAGQSAWCAARIEALATDAVIVDTIFRAPLLREPKLRHLNKVVTAPDLFFQRHRTMAAAGYRVYPAELSREMEAELLGVARSIVAIQPDEAAQISMMCPAQRVCITPMPAIPCLPPSGQKKLADRLVFVGSDTLPNIDGLRWFFSEAWPLLRKWLPNVTLDLVGDCGTAVGRLPAGVTRLGRVQNLSAVLHRAALTIAPLRFGSGLKIKMLDYARHGLVTVATPESLLGFAADMRAPFIPAGDARAFAQAIATKLRTPGASDQQDALDYVRRYYSAEVSFSGLAEVLNILPARSGSYA